MGTSETPIELGDVKEIDLFMALAAVVGATAKVTDKVAFKARLNDFAVFYEGEGNAPGAAKTVRALMKTILT
jgi:hypothetical protein